ncbi:MAG: hypothetical protein AAGG68_26440 [Bacteroidota bacterium]
MLNLLKYLLLLPLTLLFLWILSLNFKLHHQPTIIQNEQGQTNQEVIYQLYHLKEQFGQGAAQEMQQLFPEGFLFLHSLYALTWSDVATDVKPESEVFSLAINEINYSLGQIQSEEGRRIFPESMEFTYGAFYNGWAAYSMGNRLILQSDSLLEVRFKQICDRIAIAYCQNDYNYLESYHGSIWPADNVVCLASLRLYDRIFDSKYQSVVDSCLLRVKANLDAETGLIPHSTVAETMQVREGARGCSQSLINNFLIEIDSTFAFEQFKIYKELFVENRLGLMGIREYPKGRVGKGDIDSGPVIWDIGGAASIVAMRTFTRYGEIEIARSLQNSVEAFGMPIRSNKKKRYLFGALPMADAFVAWGNALNQRKVEKVAFPRWRFHLISLVLLIVIGFCIRTICK